MLKGYWPNDSSGNPYTINGLDTGGQTGILCDRCHEGMKNQTVHIKATVHKNAPCYRCHIVVPHGGKLQRLIGDCDSTMPDRYGYNGSKSAVYVRSYKWESNTSDYDTSDCAVSNAGCVSGGRQKHPTTASGTADYNW